MPDLTDFQLEVTRLFFSLPASKGFLLAGGAALLAQHLDDTAYGRPGFLHRPGPRPRARGTRRAGSRSTEAGLDIRAHPRQRHILPARHLERRSLSGDRSRRGYAPESEEIRHMRVMTASQASA